MKRSVRLSLKKEVLADLSDDVLSGLAGASATFGATCYTCTCRSCLDCLIGATLPQTACVPDVTFRTICDLPVGGNATGPTCATCLDCLPPSLRHLTCDQTAPTQYRTCTCS